MGKSFIMRVKKGSAPTTAPKKNKAEIAREPIPLQPGTITDIYLDLISDNKHKEAETLLKSPPKPGPIAHAYIELMANNRLADATKLLKSPPKTKPLADAYLDLVTKGDFEKANKALEKTPSQRMDNYFEFIVDDKFVRITDQEIVKNRIDQPTEVKEALKKELLDLRKQLTLPQKREALLTPKSRKEKQEKSCKRNNKSTKQNRKISQRGNYGKTRF